MRSGLSNGALEMLFVMSMKRQTLKNHSWPSRRHVRSGNITLSPWTNPRAGVLGTVVAGLLVACGPQPSPETSSPKGPPHTPAGLPGNRQIVLQTSNSPAGAEIARRLTERDAPPLVDTSTEPAALIAEFEGASPTRREEILALLGASGSASAWSFLAGQAGAPDQAMRLAALNALAMHDGGDPAEIIGNCLNFPDEETRALAATLLGRRVQDGQVWAQAATDPSPEVRIAYLAAVEDVPTSIRLTAARAALAKGDPQLRTEAASVLGGARNKEAVELLIPLLDDPAAGSIAADGLFYFFGRGFSSAAEASSWWSSQAASYGTDLQPIFE